MSLPIDELERMVRATIERLLRREREQEVLERRLDILESWAQDPQVAFPEAGTRLRKLELQLVLDHKAIVAAVVAQIRSDPQLRELLRGPRGLAGDPGKPGPPGDAGATVIRETRISG